ncbi:unnamed protein product [Bursaphelenchus xylophilus]|nr:unnamed protein product [Bursaphelenchus xylophilus]CAG9100851.1 unnamed protein product [Bursaphelenchus xylophilus]
MDSTMCESTLETTGFTDGPPTLFPAELESQLAQMEKPKPQPKETTIYYQWDQDESLYRTTIPVAPHKLTLAHLKCALNMTNIKCFMMKMDPNVKHEVKMDIQDDDEILEPNSEGNYIFYFMSFDENQQPGTLRKKTKRPVVPAIKPVMQPRKPPPPMHRQPSTRHHKPQYQTNGLLSEESSSDDDSCNVTSISKQSERRHRTRRPRHRRAWSPSFLSTTMETDISVSVNLYNVTLNPTPELPFGLNVLLRENGKQEMLTVGSLVPGGCVALDGRILPGHIIVEVNKEPLGDLTGTQALNVLKDAVERATRNRGQVQLTVAHPMDHHTYFQPPDQSIHPIDPAEWVRSTAEALGVPDHKFYSMESAMNFRARATGTWPSSGVGSSIVSSAPDRKYTMDTPPAVIVQAMTDPRHGVPRSSDNQHLLNISNGFIGIHIINWLSDNVIGLDDSETSARYAENLINNKFLIPITPSKAFSRQGYYTVNWDILPRSEHLNTLRRGVLQELKPALDDTLLPKKNKGCFPFCMKKEKRR